MDQSEADWGHWSLNNASDTDMTPLLEGDLTADPAQDSDGTTRLNADQVLPGEEGLGPDYTFDYDDDVGHLSGSADSQQSESEILEEMVDVASPGAVAMVADVTSSLPSTKSTARCEYCGLTGDRELFSKLKKFCSIGCSRSFTAAVREGKPIPVLHGNLHPKTVKVSQSQGKKIRPGGQQRIKPQVHTIPSASKQNVSRSFDWGDYLTKTRANGAPVTSFKHSVLADSWENISVGMKVEVMNTDCSLPTTVYWIATVIKLAGYKALMRYEGFGADTTKDFWISVCTGRVQPVGWCAANNKSLVPPKTIQHKYLDWKDFLVKRLTGARTLPHNFHKRVQQGLRDCPLRHHMAVEVVDKMCVSAMRVATVEQIVGGARVRLQYQGSTVENDDFWCHRNSPLIHPVGWSQLVGHKLHATAEYKTESLNKAALRKYSENDATPEMFQRMRELPANSVKFTAKMKLEAIDPLNLSCICVATVMKVLRNNYLMIGIDGSMAENGYDWFCYHATSPCIFPVGFCEINNLELTPPRGYKGKFSWFDYLKQTHSLAAPVQVFDKVIPKHGFKSGMKLEAVDLMEPRLICVGSVVKVVGRLLRVHFDGWESSYDQWVDCQSPDIYPVGWCEMVNYHLEGPKSKESPPPMPSVAKKRKSKSQMYRGPRKKRKAKTLPFPVLGLGVPRPHLLLQQCSVDSSDMSQDSLPLESPPPVTQPEPSSATDLLPESGDDTGSDPLVAAPADLLITMATGTTAAPSGENTMMPADGMLTDNTPLCETAGTQVPLQQQPATAAVETSVPSPAVAVETPVLPPVFTAVATETTVLQALATTTPTAMECTATTSVAQDLKDTQLPPGSSAVHLETLVSQAGFKNDLAASLPSIVTMLNSPTKQPIQRVSLVAATTEARYFSPMSSIQKPQLRTPQAAAPQFASQKVAQYGISRVVSHNIPRVVSGDSTKGCSGPATVGTQGGLSPHLWSVFDVCQFLRINDSGAFCEGFRRENIDGPAFMTLTKEQIVNLTGMKVGPSLKIYDMIQVLKRKLVQDGSAAAHQAAAATSQSDSDTRLMAALQHSMTLSLPSS